MPVATIAPALAATPPTTGDMMKDLLRPTIFALVGMFFALSGFLITGSAIRTANVKAFFANRALRLLPALSVEVTLSALVLGPLVTDLTLRDYFTDHRFFRYFGKTVGHITYVLPEVFVTNPWPEMVNATLWTLPAEFWCYAIMLCLLLTGIVGDTRRLSWAIVALVAIALGLTITNPVLLAVRAANTHFTTWYIIVMFLFGALAYTKASYIPLRRSIFLVSILLFYLLMQISWLEAFSGIPLTYCMIYIGMTSFPRIDKAIPVDLSYGIYLYGFPITQFFIYILYPSLRSFGQLISFVVIYPPILILVVLFSLVSWVYLEKPALSLRRHILREPPRPA